MVLPLSDAFKHYEVVKNIACISMGAPVGPAIMMRRDLFLVCRKTSRRSSWISKRSSAFAMRKRLRTILKRWHTTGGFLNMA